MDIGARIKALREQKGMTADELGRQVGRDRQSVYLWEKGTCVPSADALNALVKLGVLTRAEAIEMVLGPDDADGSVGGEAA